MTLGSSSLSSADHSGYQECAMRYLAFLNAEESALDAAKALAHADPGAALSAAPSNVAQLLLGYLKLEGVDTLFGIPGAAVMQVAHELRAQRGSFRYVVSRHETGAAYMADGYARVSGRLGVVLVTSGPGATNALTGTMNAQQAGVPMLTITGEVAQRFFGRGFLQEGTDVGLNVEAVYGSASGYSAIVTDPGNFPTLLTQALRDALGQPARAAHLSLPNDVAAAKLTSAWLPDNTGRYRAVAGGARRDDMARAFARLTQFERPLILLGNGCRNALRGDRLQAFTEFVERWAIPVVTTPGAKGIFPESHPLSLRQFGMAYCEWTRAYMKPSTFVPGERDDYDALLVLGSALGGFATNKWDAMLLPRHSLVQVDLDQATVGRSLPLDIGIVAEAGAAIDRLLEVSAESHPVTATVKARRAFLARLKAEVSPCLEPGVRVASAQRVAPQALMGCLNDLLPSGAQVFVDAGNCVGWAMHYLRIDPPSRMFSALGMGPMGFAVGAVVGGKLAAPDVPCVAIVGDGAFLMHGNEVSTAAAHGVGAVWIVLDDNDLTMVTQGMKKFFGNDPGANAEDYALGRPDLAALSVSLGARAWGVGSINELREAVPAALKGAAEGRPQVVVVHIDAEPVPPYYQHLEKDQFPHQAARAAATGSRS